MINHNLKRQPYSHQLEGMEAMINGGYGFCNFAEPGCGKSAMVVGALNHLQVKRVLIVCPSSLKYNWNREFEYSEVEWHVVVLEGSGHQKDKTLKEIKLSAKPIVVITNYDSLDRLRNSLQNYSPEVIVADEVHACKNPKAKRTKALKSVKTARRWALTGTPVLNNPLDVWSIIDWVRPGHLHKNYFAFRAYHCNIYTGAGFPIIKGYRYLDELKRKVNAVSYRVTKEECLDLPEKMWTERAVILSPPEERIYHQMAKEMVAEIGEAEVYASTMLVKMLRLTQITSGFIMNEGITTRIGDSKLKVLEEILEELDGKKVVIWHHFKEEGAMIQELCQKLGRPYRQLIAKDDPVVRQMQVNEFQELSEPLVMIGSVAIGGMGITLTGANHCVYYSNTFSQSDRLQSQDRLHRIGQTNKVTYIDLVVPNTIDSYILKVLKNKAEIANRITGDTLSKILVDKQN